MKKLHKKIPIAFLIILLSYSAIGQQSVNLNDTLKIYLLQKCQILLKPHADLTFSFTTDELKNELPDLKINPPVLKDTAKFFLELKGNFDDWYIYQKIGKLYDKFGQKQSAFSYYEQAYNLILNQIKKDTLNSKYYSEMGTLYLNLKSNDNAFYFYKKAYELNQNDSMASLFLPMFYVQKGDFANAQKVINLKLKSDPKSIEMYVWLITVQVFKSLGELDANDKSLINKSIDELFKLADFTTGIKNNKSDIRFEILEPISRQFALFVKYLVLTNDFKKIQITPSDLAELQSIRKLLEKFISKGKFKNQYILYKSLGFNYLLDKKTDKAIECFKKSVTLWPADKVSQDYYILFTTNYFIKNDTLTALKVINEKIEKDKLFMISSAEDIVLKGDVLLASGKYNEAYTEYKKALAMDKTIGAYQGLCYIEMKNAKLTEANQWINYAYEINNSDYLTYALFGSMVILNNQVNEAKTYFEKALELKPDNETIKEIYKTFWP